MQVDSESQRPLALDLFCGAGGVSMGLYRAGFDVIGIDIKPQPHYPFRFIQADATNPPVKLNDFDFIWASPPCQAFSVLRNAPGAKQDHPNLIPATRQLLTSYDGKWCIENVPGAPLKTTFLLCGSMFDLKTPCGAELRRHRVFETNFAMLTPPCHHSRNVIGIYGGHARDRRRVISVTGSTPQRQIVKNKVRETFSVEYAKKAMGIDWMNMSELSQAIPPAYSEFIGKAALR